MVAQAVDARTFRGVRQFDPLRDLYGVARLLEEAFRPEHNFPLSQFPPLRELGIWLWTFSYAPGFPPNMSGYVWVEDGRIVGNITLTDDERHNDRVMISNVAVKPEFRGRGIARQLMQTSLEEIRSRGARVALLNVRPNNPPALHLYESLGFQQIEMRGEWSLNATPTPSQVNEAIRSIRFSDNSAVNDLLRVVVPASVEQYRLRQNDFLIAVDERIVEWVNDAMLGQHTSRWVLERNDRLAAVTMIRAQRILAPHRIAIQVHPRFRGQIENELLAFAFNQLAKFPRREVRATVTDSHPEWIAVLEKNNFVFRSGLTLMALNFSAQQ